MYALIAIALLFLNVLKAQTPSYFHIAFQSLTGSESSTEVQVVVNEVNQFQSYIIVIVPALGSTMLEFPALPGDKIEVRISEDDNNHDMYYEVRNGPFGTGTVLHDSRSNSFWPRNRCQSDVVECDFTLANLATSTWGTSRAAVYVNDVLKVAEYDGTGSVDFKALKGDVIRVEHTGPIGSDISCTITLQGDPMDYIEWFIGSFGSSAIIPNPHDPVSISEPQNGAKISAVSGSMSVSLTSSPSPNSIPYRVKLECGGFAAVEETIYSNDEEQMLPIPAGIYGVDCILSVTSPIAGLNTRAITIMLPVTLSTSTPSLRVNELIRIRADSVATTIITNIVTLIRTCGDVDYQYPQSLTLGQENEISPQTDFVGLCTFRTLEDGVFEAAAGLAVRFKNELTIELGSEDLTDGTQFGLRVSSSVPPVLEFSRINLILQCHHYLSRSALLQADLNKDINTLLYTYIIQKTPCTLMTFGFDDVFIHAVKTFTMDLKNSPLGGKMAFIHRSEHGTCARGLHGNFHANG